MHRPIPLLALSLFVTGIVPPTQGVVDVVVDGPRVVLRSLPWVTGSDAVVRERQERFTATVRTAAWLLQRRGTPHRLRVMVETQPDSATTHELVRHRARAVVRTLVRLGVPAQQLDLDCLRGGGTDDPRIELWTVGADPVAESDRRCL